MPIDEEETDAMLMESSWGGGNAGGSSAVAGDAPMTGSTVNGAVGQKKGSNLARDNSTMIGRSSDGIREMVRKAWTAFATKVGAEQNPDVAARSCTQLVFLSLIAFFVIVLPILLADDRPRDQSNIIPDDGSVLAGAESFEVMSGSHGAVACDDLLCAKLAKNILSELDGNAADAAVAAALCEGVVAPHASGLGGGVVITFYINDTQGVIDSRETAPQRADQRSTNLNSAKSGFPIGVPGELMGLYTLHKEHGRVEWATLVEFAAQLAEGTPVSRVLANRLKEAQEGILASDELRQVFAKQKLDKNENADRDDDYVVNVADADYEVLAAGDNMSNPILAETLRTIVKEPLALYHSLAPELVEDIGASGGVISVEDLQGYTPVVTSPTRTFYSGLMVLTSPLSTGGPLLAFALNFLEGYHLRKWGRNGDSFHLITEALKYAFGWRSQLGDPAFDTDMAGFVRSNVLNKEYAMHLRSQVSLQETRESSNYTDDLSKLVEDYGTSHISVVDSEGNAVSLSTTINHPFGSRLMSKSTGIILNNALINFSPSDAESGYNLLSSSKNEIDAGKRPLSSLCPTIILRNSEPYIVVGGGGGPMGISAVLQTILGVLEFGLNLGEAISEPRLHHQLFPEELRMEAVDADTCGVRKSYKRSDLKITPSFWSEVCLSLRERGHNVTFMPTVGFAHSTMRISSRRSSGSNSTVEQPKASVFAAADARKLGGAVAF